MGALNEAISTATPVVACPLFGDQFINAKLLDNRGVAVHLNFFEITKENVLSALNEIINDTRYLPLFFDFFYLCSSLAIHSFNIICLWQIL